MLKNYFKIAIAVLRRRKFFTFISLFGISFTLTILMVLTAFIDLLVSPNYPDVNRDRSLYVNQVVLKSSKQNYTQTGPAGFYLLDHYVSKMKTFEKMAFSSTFKGSNTYVNNKKLAINLSYTNDKFWEVLEFKFLEGKAFDKQSIDRGDKVAVITEDTKNSYFGKDATAVGKYFEANNVQYRVTGVVKNVPITMPYIYADVYLPYTVGDVDTKSKSLGGSFTAILLAKSKDDLDDIKKEYSQMAAKIPTNSKEYDLLFTYADKYFESLTRGMFGEVGGLKADKNSNGMGVFFLIVGIFLFIFMLLPTLNLVNINISRIMERSSEIGVRKAFGASSKTLVFQFIVENLILTFLGGLIGIVLSYTIIQIINSSQLIPNAELSINLNVLMYSVMTCILFGFISGVYPAWRMSKMHVVNALKA